jgi:SAM-dependent methyltransferase
MTVDFYARVVRAVHFDPADSVVVLCGGPYDARSLSAIGMRDVLITNLDHHDGVKDLSPYKWSYQDAENVTLPDASADWAIVSAGLHHCASPHRGLCEMLRIARKGVVVIEARDSLLMRLANRFGLSPEFETEPVFLNKGLSGGVRNTKVPNFIYRWTEREFTKTVSSYIPQEEFEFDYVYGYSLPVQRMSMSKNPLKRALVTVLASFQKMFEVLLPKQGNNFAMVARRNGQLKPWLKADGKGDVDVDMDYLGRSNDASKYKKP